MEENTRVSKQTKIEKPILLSLIECEIQFLKNYQKQFEEWGFKYKIQDNNIQITYIPSLFLLSDSNKKVSYIIFNTFIL